MTVLAEPLIAHGSSESPHYIAELCFADFQARSYQAIQREPLRRVRPTLQRP